MDPQKTLLSNGSRDTQTVASATANTQDTQPIQHSAVVAVSVVSQRGADEQQIQRHELQATNNALRARQTALAFDNQRLIDRLIDLSAAYSRLEERAEQLIHTYQQESPHLLMVKSTVEKFFHHLSHYGQTPALEFLPMSATQTAEPLALPSPIVDSMAILLGDGSGAEQDADHVLTLQCPTVAVGSTMQSSMDEQPNIDAIPTDILMLQARNEDLTRVLARLTAQNQTLTDKLAGLSEAYSRLEARSVQLINAQPQLQLQQERNNLSKLQSNISDFFRRLSQVGQSLATEALPTQVAAPLVHMLLTDGSSTNANPVLSANDSSSSSSNNRNTL